MQFLGAKLAKTAHAGVAPQAPFEKQLTALLTSHSWIRGRVCVIISNKTEILKGKKRDSKSRKGSS